MKVLRSAFRLVWGASGREFRIMVALDIVAAVSSAVVLALAGRILGQLAEADSFGEIVPSLIGVAIATLVTSGTSIVRGELSALAIEKVSADSVAQILRASTHVPYRLFDSTEFYDQLRRAYESAQNQAWSMVRAMIDLGRTLADVVAVLVVLVWIAPQLIVVAAVAFVPLWLVSQINSRAIYRFSWALTEDDRRRDYIESVLTDRAAAKEARVYTLDDSLGAQHRSIWLDRVVRLAKLIRTRIGVSMLGNAFSTIIMTSALGLVVWLTVRGDLSIAEAGVGVLGVRRLQMAVSSGSVAVDVLNAGRLYLEDFTRFVDMAEGHITTPAHDAVLAPDTVDRIVVDEVTFAYDEGGRPALDNVSLELRRGELTAIVGPNGSGKTTLLHLLARLYEPDSGTVKWDNADVSELDLSSYHTRLGALFQDFAKYELLASDNVDLASPTWSGEPDLDRTAAVERAIESAGARRVIDRLPQGVGSQLGRAFDDGVELSVGEWQRLALARALYRENAPLILLDEPAASLDSMAELEIVERMRELAQNTVLVYISHRFASVSRADRIVVMADGRVIEDGSHEHLVALGGVYAAMFHAQARAFESASRPQQTPGTAIASAELDSPT